MGVALVMGAAQQQPAGFISPRASLHVGGSLSQCLSVKNSCICSVRMYMQKHQGMLTPVRALLPFLVFNCLRISLVPGILYCVSVLYVSRTLASGRPAYLPMRHFLLQIKILSIYLSTYMPELAHYRKHFLPIVAQFDRIRIVPCPDRTPSRGCVLWARN